MTTGATVASGVGLFAALLMIGYAYVNATRDVSSEDLDVSPRAFFAVAAVVFGGLGVIVAGAITVGTVHWGMAAETVGLGSDPLRSAGIGVVAGLLLAGFHKLLVTGLEAAGLEFTRIFEEMVPETVPGIAWFAAGSGVQASAEEVIFRAALVGAPAGLLSISPWYFVLPAAILFGLAHTGRGMGSILSTAVVGVVLGGLFVSVGLVAAAVAHVVNNVVGFVYAGFFADHDGSEPEQAEPIGD